MPFKNGAGKFPLREEGGREEGREGERRKGLVRIECHMKWEGGREGGREEREERRGNQPERSINTAHRLFPPAAAAAAAPAAAPPPPPVARVRCMAFSSSVLLARLASEERRTDQRVTA
jgi:hypothetical protein